MATEACITKTPKGLGFFEKYLTVWVVLCILAGILLGKTAPEAAVFLDGLAIYGPRCAGGLHPHRHLSLLHDVPDHGQNRLHRGAPGGQELQTGEPDPDRQLADQTVHHVRHLDLLPRHALSRIHRPRSHRPGEDAAGPGPAGGREPRCGHGGDAGRGEDAGGAAVAQLPRRLHPAGHRPLHGHGAGLGLSGPGQRRPHPGDGGHQLAGHALSLRPAGRLPARRGPAAGALAGAAAVHRHLRRPAPGGRVSLAQVADRPQRARPGSTRSFCTFSPR